MTIDNGVNILVIPARLVSHHNLYISDTFFCNLQVRHQLVVLVEAEHLSHLNMGGRKGGRKGGGGTNTLVVGRLKIIFREKEEVDWLLLTRNINGFDDGNSIEGCDDMNVDL